MVQTETPSRASIMIGGKAFRAVLFDMDGVVTDTARLHLAAWHRLFQDLTERGDVGNVELNDDDYRQYIDGKDRGRGLMSYLDSRRVVVPPGTPDDSPNAITIRNLLRRKNTYFLDELDRNGVEVIAPTVRWIQQLRSMGVRTAVVSASKNARFVLDRAGLTNYFDARVDGIDTATLGLSGKPDPDTYIEAARRLSMSPSECVVVEDATAGIRAGRSGGFGLCVGLGPTENFAALTESGADVAVSDVSQIDYLQP
ncbi:beta-phosphoglucomutase family hydrolase [Rhodococcus sp. IEGM 1379]|uniref:HAD family hydrolase n=1 Tax=Rhodococcus sp. IEGM 1379 TaxID=3047086 RepID=UPI0024B8216F|nr:beta-phosphoglucomutase family hydrolase [Rhodococcus sp. IEGM 1379]MDI9914472.1 beta-phosphoglucomutase family hydrolase [Rhodococcus sp. IEGM 1379]